ncbi:MAG: 50S ribosomal protein L22 [Chloroflexi bacterium]|nr:50S ribosomal protein L22 [Chloroflexota bacterium]
MEVKSTGKYIRMSPRKVRLVTEAIKGRPAEEALVTLRYMPQAAAVAVAKVLKSAVANAENNYNLAAEDLYISRATADEGPTMRRMRSRARGRWDRVLKRSTNITVIVKEREEV